MPLIMLSHNVIKKEKYNDFLSVKKEFLELCLPPLEIQ